MQIRHIRPVSSNPTIKTQQKQRIWDQVSEQFTGLRNLLAGGSIAQSIDEPQTVSLGINGMNGLNQGTTTYLSPSASESNYPRMMKGSKVGSSFMINKQARTTSAAVAMMKSYEEHASRISQAKRPQTAYQFFGGAKKPVMQYICRQDHMLIIEEMNRQELVSKRRTQN